MERSVRAVCAADVSWSTTWVPSAVIECRLPAPRPRPRPPASSSWAHILGHGRLLRLQPEPSICRARGRGSQISACPSACARTSRAPMFGAPICALLTTAGLTGIGHSVWPCRPHDRHGRDAAPSHGDDQLAAAGAHARWPSVPRRFGRLRRYERRLRVHGHAMPSVLYATHLRRAIDARSVHWGPAPQESPDPDRRRRR
jgi:hypothetical protein